MNTSSHHATTAATVAPGDQHPAAAKPKTSLFMLMDCTLSMETCAVLYRRSSKNHDVWSRTDEQWMPFNGLQQTDIAAGLLEKHYAHVDGAVEVLKDLFEKNEGTANIYTFGAGPHQYKHVIKHCRSMKDLGDIKGLYEKFTPRHEATAILQSTKSFLETVLMAREMTHEDTLLAVCIATDGNDNVGAPPGTNYEALKQEVRDLMKKAQEHKGIKLTFVAAGANAVLQMAMHQMGVKQECAIYLNSHNPAAVRSCFRAVSTQVADPKFRSMQVDYGAAGPTPLARGQSGAGDLHAGNHFGGYTAAPLPQSAAAVPPPPAFTRQCSGVGRGSSAGVGF